MESQHGTTGPEQEDAAEITAQRLRLIDTGVSRSGSIKADLKHVKQNYDVIYQPQVNIVDSDKDKEVANIVASPTKSARSHDDADSSAVQISEKKRRKSHPPQVSYGCKQRMAPQLDCIDFKSNISEDYKYKSPSKMTSPEKKAFS